MASVKLGTKAIGDIVKIKVNGVYKDFIVVHQGKPSSVYDDSCAGTWLLMKDIYTTSAFSSSSNSYKDSSIHSYLNSTFYNLIDSDIRAAIKQVKIPYQNGTGSGGSLATGANGLSTKVFLLSGYEVGWTPGTSSDSYNYSPRDGVKLDYFGSGSGGNRKRVAYNGSSTAVWWLRSPITDRSVTVWYVSIDGSIYDYWYSVSCGVRPAFILPSELMVSEDGMFSLNTAPSTPNRVVIPSNIMGGTTITVSWANSSDAENILAGYKAERSTDGGSSWFQIYQGMATSTTNRIPAGITSVMYRVKAYDDEGLESGWKTSQQVTVVNNTAPSAPPSISAPDSVKGGGTLVVSWAAASDSDGNLAGYILERSTDGGNTYTHIYDGSALTYTDTINKEWTTVMYRVKAYDDEGLESGWKTSQQVTVVNNTAPSAPPSISAPDSVKGGGTLVISWAAASDSDGNLAGYILERSTNGGSSWSKIYQGTATRTTNVIKHGTSSVMYRVKAYDTEGLESAYKTSPKITIINNAAPVITTSSSTLGEKNAAFSWTYTVTDADGDSLTVTEKLDGKTTKTRTGVASGTTLTFEQASTAAGFQKILNGQHSITIEVSDGKETVSASATFTKAVHAASVTLAEPLAVEGDITVAVLQVARSIPDDAKFKAEVTNNALDSSPVWQDATTEVVNGTNIIFTNQTFTNGAAFNFRVSVERGASGEGGYIEAVSGAFQ